jgi:tRNA A37 threonylcarbamoyladenosine dehydratase
MVVGRVSYNVNWGAFERGASIFIPCLDSIKAKAEVAVVLKRLRIKVITKVRIEDGIRGLRMWRL